MTSVSSALLFKPASQLFVGFAGFVVNLQTATPLLHYTGGPNGAGPSP